MPNQKGSYYEVAAHCVYSWLKLMFYKLLMEEVHIWTKQTKYLVCL